jgi:hypothetical protein
MSTTLAPHWPVTRSPGVVLALTRTAAEAIRAHLALFFSLTAGLVALSIALPPIVLSVVRKPWTYFTFNPWLKQLPAYLTSDRPLTEKLDFLSRAALFWFSADGPYGAPEWGFAVDTGDLARMVAMALLVATYFCLLLRRRDQGRLPCMKAPGYRGSGALGALVGVLGLSTGPCSVVGCGAPVLPVIGLAFAGLSSGTLALLSGLSRAMTLVVAAALVAGVAYLAWPPMSEEAPR